MTMKHCLLTTLLAGTVAAQAADYQYLTIQKNDGTAQSLTAIGLTITYSNGSLTATNGSESATFALTDVKSMFFSNTKETTLIEATAADLDDPETEIYDLSGRKIGNGASSTNTLRKGIYIFKKGNTTTKKYVK